MSESPFGDIRKECRHNCNPMSAKKLRVAIRESTAEFRLTMIDRVKEMLAKSRASLDEVCYYGVCESMHIESIVLPENEYRDKVTWRSFLDRMGLKLKQGKIRPSRETCLVAPFDEDEREVWRVVREFWVDWDDTIKRKNTEFEQEAETVWEAIEAATRDVVGDEAYDKNYGDDFETRVREALLERDGW
jgi:hypothetical protein